MFFYSTDSIDFFNLNKFLNLDLSKFQLIDLVKILTILFLIFFIFLY